MQILPPLSCLPRKELCLGKLSHIFSTSGKVVSCICCLFWSSSEKSQIQGSRWWRSIYKCVMQLSGTRINRRWVCCMHTLMYVCTHSILEWGPSEGWDFLAWNVSWGHNKHSLGPSCTGTSPCLHECASFGR